MRIDKVIKKIEGKLCIILHNNLIKNIENKTGVIISGGSRGTGRMSPSPPKKKIGLQDVDRYPKIVNHGIVL